MEWLQWAFITLALSLIFIVFAINPLQQGIDEAIKGNARLQAERIASAINIISGAPGGTTYTLEMPDIKCTVTITNSFVRMHTFPTGGPELDFSVSIIKTPVTITTGQFECRKDLNMRLARIGNLLKITVG